MLEIGFVVQDQLHGQTLGDFLEKFLKFPFASTARPTAIKV